jgi:integrase
VKNKTVTIDKQLKKLKDPKNPGKQAYYMLASTKSEESIRMIPLNSYVINEFWIHKKWHAEQQCTMGYQTDFIFTTQSGHHIDKRCESVTFRRFYKRIGVPYRRFHVYRHTFGTNLCKRGVPIQVTSKLLGHASIEVTSKYYVHVDEKQKIEAIEKLSSKGK